MAIATYGPEKIDRLAAVKRRYDPDNLFRLNHNIPPGEAHYPWESTRGIRLTTRHPRSMDVEAQAGSNHRAVPRGAAAGTASAFMDLGLGFGPIALGLVADAAGIPWAFGVGGGIAFLGAAWTWRLVARTAREFRNPNPLSADGHAHAPQ